MTLPKHVRVVEVGPRDGLQNETTILSADVRANFILELMDCGLNDIEAGSFVHPKWVPQLAQTDAVLAKLPLHSDINFPVLVPNIIGLENALKCDVREIAIFAAASESFSQKNINCSIAQSIQRFEPVVERAHSLGIKVRGYVSCVVGCPYEGTIEVKDVVKIVDKLDKIGCYEISLGDTIGVGTPLQINRLIEHLTKTVEVSRLAVHFHDTYGQALANIYAALTIGINVIDASVAGLGGCPYARGASGNVATEDVVYMLNGLGISHGIDLGKLINTGRAICDQLDRPVMSRVNLAMA